MKRFLECLFPRPNFWRMLFIMLPAALIGWLFFPIGTITYIDWILVFMMIQIWDDLMDIREEMKK